MREKSRPAIIDQGGQENSGVPIRGQIADLAFGQNRLEPCQHQFSGREFGSSDLVSNDQRPDESEDQFQVPVHDVNVS